MLAFCAVFAVLAVLACCACCACLLCLLAVLTLLCFAYPWTCRLHFRCSGVPHLDAVDHLQVALDSSLEALSNSWWPLASQVKPGWAILASRAGGSGVLQGARLPDWGAWQSIFPKFRTRCHFEPVLCSTSRQQHALNYEKSIIITSKVL